jgi:hypothetical protein
LSATLIVTAPFLVHVHLPAAQLHAMAYVPSVHTTESLDEHAEAAPAA